MFSKQIGRPKMHCVGKQLLFLLLVFTLMLLSGCRFPSDDISDQAYNLAQANEEHVLGVKYGSPNSYPDITYADAFEAFFGSPTWKYFEGTRDDSDKVYDVVEFTGTCLYQDVEVKARIQFTISDDGKTFEATYLSFNDVPQTNIILYALIEKAFSEYQEKADMASQEAKPTS